MHEITMPKAGDTMEDGTVVRWLKAEGESVRQGEILLEIETEEATIEIESAQSGTLLKILVPEGRTVPAGALIGVLGEPGEDIRAAVDKAEARQAGGEAAGPVADRKPQPAPAPQAKPAASAGAPQAAAPKPAAPKPAAPGGAVTPVLMPQAGNTMEEGTIVKWCVGPGDRIAEGDIIFEVETDKATIEVEATDSGRLARIVVPEDETIEVLQPVAYLADNDADVDAYIAAHGDSAATGVTEAAGPAVVETKSAEPQAAPAAPAVSPGGRVKASPAARRIAAQRGVDISTVKSGSGPGGRIVSTDVPAAPGAKPQAAPARRRATVGDAVRRPMSRMRRAIARALLASKQTIPHFYVRLTIDADPLMSFYRGQKAKYPCTLNDVIVLACARVMQEFPAFRSQIDGDQIVQAAASNVGIAVGTEEGLIVPVVVGAEGMSLEQLAAESRRIVEAARGGKIEGMGKGLFTITNLGMFGVEEFAGIINPPEAAILAVGAVREEAIVSDGVVRPGRVMTVTLSADHRIVDGLAAAKFLARLKEVLENPSPLA